MDILEWGNAHMGAIVLARAEGDADAVLIMELIEQQPLGYMEKVELRNAVQRFQDRWYGRSESEDV
jgi:hypothetical protein